MREFHTIAASTASRPSDGSVPSSRGRVAWFAIVSCITLVLAVDAGAAPIKSVQSGTAVSSGNGTVTVTINPVDMTKSFVIFQTRHNSNRPPGSMIRGRIATASSLEFVRVTNETTTMTIQWYVVEFSSGVKVQRGEVTQAATTINVTLPTAVAAVNQAFVTWSKSPVAGDGSYSEDDPIVGELTSTTNLQFRVNIANSVHVIGWQVIEFTNPADINVQKGTITTMTGATTSVTATLSPPVDVNKTFLLVGFQSSGRGTDVGSRLLRAQLTNSTTITIDRAIAGTPDDITEIVWQAVELNDGSTVQRGTENFVAGIAQKTVPITAVDTSRAVAFASVQLVGGQNMGKSPYAGDDIIGVGSATMSLASTSITMDRINTVASTDIGWFVVEWAPLVFGDVTTAAGLSGISNYTYYGLDWGDYNNDGHPDLYVSGTNALYKNDGDGTFSAGPALTGNDRGVHWGDYDNDGDLDFGACLDMKLSLNNGDGTFTLQSNAAIGITSVSNWGDFAWLDYNLDGKLDIWAPNGSSPYAYMYANNGGGTFSAIDGDTIGLAANTNGESTIVADYDGDGYTDILYRAGSVYLFHNDGDGTFTNVTAAAGISFSGTGGGYNGTAFGDYDGDGDLDLYGGQGGSNKLYRNNDNGTFTDVTSTAGVAGLSATTKGVAWGDYDNDGDLDLYVAQENAANQLFRNNGDGTFTDVAPTYGLDDTSASYGAMWEDYDLDGDLDLFVGGSAGASKLWRNYTDNANYLRVRVLGRGAGRTNKAAIGVRVDLYDAIGTTFLATREIGVASSLGSSELKWAHFGGVDPATTYTVKVHFVSGTIDVTVVPSTTSTTIGSTTIPQMLTIEERGVKIVSWQEVEP